MAATKNFASAAHDWFNEDLSRLNFHLMPLCFVTPPSATQAVKLNREEKNFFRYVRSLEARESDANARYAVAMSIEVCFVRSKSAAATPVRVTIDPQAPTVRSTEDQIRERDPWDSHEPTNKCRERDSNFKVGTQYHQLRKELEAEIRFAYGRRLDPEKPRPKKSSTHLGSWDSSTSVIRKEPESNGRRGLHELARWC